MSTGMISKLSFRNKSALFISIIAFFFLFPGIYLSMLTISTKGSIEAYMPKVQSGLLGLTSTGAEQHSISLKILDTKRSILNTVHDLWKRNYFFVASMIFLFSIIVPVLKEFLLVTIYFSKKAETRKKLFAFIKAISKWSMCDVFIVAILLSYLSTGAVQTVNSKSITMMGHAVDVDVFTGMHANLHIGFYCFVTYCLLSLIAFQLYESY